MLSAAKDKMHSCIYRGWVRHRRFTPKSHAFTYHVFMMYIDLDELDELMQVTPFWSYKKWALARFKRSDFHGDIKKSLKEAVLETVNESLGWKPSGPVRMLANLRYFGFNMNPITTYYCFDQNGESLLAIVAEVNNTPWNKRHAYVLDCQNQSPFRTQFNKRLHVSPFNPMDMDYRWLSTTPDDQAFIHLENWRASDDSYDKVMDATLSLTQRLPVSASNLNRHIIRYPWMTVKVVAAIYWQAFRLWVKKVPYVPPPAEPDHGSEKVDSPLEKY